MRGELGAVVADNRLERDGDTEVVQDLGDIQRVGVGLMGCQQLAADGDDRRTQAVSHAGIIHTHRRSARYEYNPATASSAMIPRPPCRCSSCAAGYGLTTSNRRNSRKPSTIPAIESGSNAS